MSAWSNIEISPDDTEIKLIDQLEKKIGEVSSGARKIREIITGFEVCHFKYQKHLAYIKESIQNLKAHIDLSEVGANHIRNGENAWKGDKTGRSLMGQKYVWTLRGWLGDDPTNEINDRNLDQQIAKWLGEKTPEKEDLVRLLVARLVWDWESYEKLESGDKNKELKYQVCRMDICHYRFPGNLDMVIQGIGDLKPSKAFEGCGSYNSEIKTNIETAFSALNDDLKKRSHALQPDKDEFLKTWLIACMAKTLKEQVGFSQPMDGLGKPGGNKL